MGANTLNQHKNTTSFSKRSSIKVRSSNSVNPIDHPLTQPKTSIGHDTNCDIWINEDLVSGYHFQVEEQNGLYYIVHPHPLRAQTSNGFIYQGKQFQGHEKFKHLLKHGDVFRIGDASDIIISVTFDDGSGDVQDVLPQIEDVHLRHNTLTIGRATDNDVILKHETVSAHHARLEKQGKEYRLLDLHSTNHMYVNGRRETGHDLAVNDEIQIGPFKLTYDGNKLKCNENRSIRIDVQGIHKIILSKNREKALLNDISLVIPPHAFVALVGGSGAGKSTLLKALSGLNPVTGIVNYNSQDYYKSYAAFSTQLGYVPQDDIVHRELTVQSALYYGAKLRLPNDYTEAQIQTRIREVLEEVELDKKQDTLVNMLSGGQRKRVSIALELLANPSVFFLDEPTSGLDPGLDLKMMNLLRKLADKGQTIVLVTHATTNINICDYVCFLGAGRLVYFGSPHQTKLFFNKTDFPEIYNELDNEQACKSWSEKFHRSPDYQTYIAHPLQIAGSKQGQPAKVQRSKQNRTLRQWLLLCKRYLELLINDRSNLGILLLQAPAIALLIFMFINMGVGAGGFDTTKVVQCPITAQVFTTKGLPDTPGPSSPVASKDCQQLEKLLNTTPQGKAYALRRGGSIQALQDFIIPGPGDAHMILFIMAFAAIMCGCINSSREIVKEDPIYRRERAVNLGILPYLFSKIAVLGILCLLQSIALVGIISLVDPFPHGTFLPGWTEVYITIALTSLAGLMLGLTTSAIVPTSDRAMSLLPLLLLPQVVFSGTLFPLTNPVLQIIGMAFPTRWAMAALSSTVGIHGDKEYGPGQEGDKIFGNNSSYHSTLFSTYSTTDATWHLIHMWIALGTIIVVLMLITAGCLKLKDRRGFGYMRQNCIQCKKKLPYPNTAKCPSCGKEQFA